MTLLTTKKQHIVKYGDMIERNDPYFWIRDDTRSNPEVIELLEKNNKHCLDNLKDVDFLRDELYNDMQNHVKETASSFPKPHGDGNFDSLYKYYHKIIEGLGYPIYCRVNIKTNTEEILIDVNLLAKEHDFCSVEYVSTSYNHKILSFVIDIVGNEKYNIKLIDLTTKEEIINKIPIITGGLHFWAPDNKNIYYLISTETDRVFQLWRYNIELCESYKIFEETDELFNIDAKMSDDNKYLYIYSTSSSTSEQWYLEYGKTDIPTILFPRKKDHKYMIYIHNKNYVIKTNSNGYQNFRLLYGNDLNFENWKTLIMNDKILVDDIQCFNNFLAVKLKENGITSIKIYKYNDTSYDEMYQQLPFDETGTLNFESLNIYDTNLLWITHESMISPISIHQIDMDTGNNIQLWQKEVQNYDKSKYETKRIYAFSHDNTMIPISLMYKKGYDKNRPLYLYGYGAYGLTIDPTLEITNLPLIDAGFVYAIAHVRGGGFVDYKWYLDGKLDKKKNTFLDFIACTEHLIKTGYASPSSIVIEGQSAGGLLVGAVMNMRPDLYCAVIGGVPFVDALNSMSDPTIPLVIPEWEEWGNANDPIQYNWIKEYSPYDNLRETCYPHCLMTGSLFDPRVGYWEPVKFISKLRELHEGEHKMHLLLTDMNTGHFGDSDRYRYLYGRAIELSFVLKVLNL